MNLESNALSYKLSKTIATFATIMSPPHQNNEPPGPPGHVNPVQPRPSILRRVHTFGRQFIRTALQRLGTGFVYTLKYIFRRKNRIHPTISVTDLMHQEQGSSSDSDSSGSPKTHASNSFNLNPFGRGRIFRPSQNFTDSKTVLPKKQDLTKLIVHLPLEVTHCILLFQSNYFLNWT